MKQELREAQLFVRFSRTFVVNGIRLSDSVVELLAVLERKIGIPPASLWLSFGGRCLAAGRSLSSYGLSSGATVHLAVRGRGGGCSSSKGNILAEGNRDRSVVKLGAKKAEEAEDAKRNVEQDSSPPKAAVRRSFLSGSPPSRRPSVCESPHQPTDRNVEVKADQDALWKHHGGDVLEQAIRSGAIALCEAKWLVEFAKSGGVLPRRQDLPEDAFITLSELKSIGCPAAALPIIEISHAWLHPDHPDPKGEYLSLLGKALQAYTGGQRYGVFYDYLSLHQHPNVKEGIKRTDAEDQLFKQGVLALSSLFAHRKTTMFRISKFPKGYPEDYDLPKGANVAPYYNRAWCFAESCWASLTKDAEFCLEVSKFTESMLTRDDVVRNCKQMGRKTPPLLPAEFASELHSKQFTRKPRDETALLLDMYKAAFQGQFGRSIALNYSSLAWGNKELIHLAKGIEVAVPVRLKGIYLFDNQISCEGLKSLSKAMSRLVLANVEELSLRENLIANDGIKALSTAVSNGALPNLQKLYLERNRIGDDGLKFFSSAAAGGALAKLEVLVLSMNIISDVGFKFFSEAAGKGGFAQVQRLYFEGNRIGDNGMKALSAAIEVGALRNLESLWLGTNGIGSEGLEAFSTAVAQGHLVDLKELFLGSNKIGNEGINSLSRTIAAGSMANLEWLSLRDNQISEDAMSAFTEAIDGGSLTHDLNPEKRAADAIRQATSKRRIKCSI